MKKISLCMIVKNEESVIGRCLESVKDFVDEIIIVDTGSTDKTKEIVRKYTKKVYDFKWVEDFSKARNYSFSKATKEYIMWLDADDVVSKENAVKIQQIKETSEKPDIYMFKYNYLFDEYGNPTIIQNRARLLRRDKKYKWTSPIHEVIVPSGNIVNTDICVDHRKEKINDPTRNLRIFLKMKEEGKEFDIRQEYAYILELFGQKELEDTAIDECNLFYEKYVDKYAENQYYLYRALLDLSECYKKREDTKNEKEALMRIIANQEPHILVCSHLGDLFFREQNYDAAIYWLKEAINCKVDKYQVSEYDHYFLPYQELGICYYYKSDFKKALEYCEKAGELRPYDECYKKNKEIYLQCLEGEK